MCTGRKVHLYSSFTEKIYQLFDSPLCRNLSDIFRTFLRLHMHGSGLNHRLFKDKTVSHITWGQRISDSCDTGVNIFWFYTEPSPLTILQLS